jgi:signal transduction histidine kinase
MKKLSFRIGFYLSINLILIITSFYNLDYVFKRPRAPFHLIRHGNGLIIDKIIDPAYSGDLKVGDRIISWNSFQLNIPRIPEFLAEMSMVDESVIINFERSGDIYTTTVTLLHYYPSFRYVFIIFFVGFITWCVSVFVLLKGPPEISTTVLHWTLASFGFVIMLTTGIVHPKQFFPYLSRFLFLIFYMATVSGLFYFSAIFPRPKPGSAIQKALLIFIPAALFTLPMIYYHLRAIYFFSPDDFARFQVLFDIFHISLYIFVGGSLLNFLHSYFTISQVDVQRRLRLIFWGILLGAAPFLLVSILPQILGRSELIREEYTLIFFLLIPCTFTLAILKYRLLDINLMINRTLVYGLLTMLIGSLYIVSVLLVISAIGGEIVFSEYLLLLLTTLFIAIIFNPLRRKLQKIVDNLFFSVRENFRKAVLDIRDDLDSAWSSEGLFQQLIISLSRFVPNQQLALYRAENQSLYLLSSSRVESLKQISCTGADLTQLIDSGQICAIPKSVYMHREQIDFSQTDFLQIINFQVCVPVKTKTTGFRGLLCAIPYHDRFIQAELDLLQTSCIQAAGNLDRLLLQERMIIEREENRRMKEITSYIISKVAHEMQSPLTSIRLFAEMPLQKGSLTPEEQTEYLHIIESESIRLSRLVKNVLDHTRIDKGIKKYQFEILNLNGLVEHVLHLFRPQLEQENFEVITDLTEEDTTLMADEEALVSALTNLLTNAIKYSPEEKYLHISTALLHQHLRFTIRDKGLGIPEEEQPRIFTDFYRSDNKKVQSVSGLGLGLSLVKSIIDAHKGTIQLESKPGQGTLFTITLPAGVTYEKNITH